MRRRFAEMFKNLIELAVGKRVLNFRLPWSSPMAAASQPLFGIEPKMYRHFVAATLMISAAVAIFMDSGEPDSVVAEMQTAKQQADRARAQQVHASKPELIDNRSGAAQSGGRDRYYGGQYGAPMDNVGDSGTTIVPPAAIAPVSTAIDPAILNRMSPAQRTAYLKQLEEQRRKIEAQGPYRPSPQEINSLTAASAARSGVE